MAVTPRSFRRASPCRIRIRRVTPTLASEESLLAAHRPFLEADSPDRRRSFLTIWSLLLVLGALGVLGISRPRPTLPDEPRLEIATTAASSLTEPSPPLHTRSQLAFIENTGQWPADVSFTARGADFSATFDSDHVALRIRRIDESGHRHVVPVDLLFVDARSDVEISGEQPLPGVHHYLLGSDSKRWRRNVPRYGKIHYEDLYDGIDLVVREGSGALQYDLLAAPGADWRSVTIATAGVTAIETTNEGGLLLITPWGPIEQGAPEAWYERPDGERAPVACRYRVVEGLRFGFEVAEEAPWPLVIDPPLEWSTLLGGSDLDWLSQITISANEEAIVAGTTASVDFPTTPGAWDVSLANPSWDVFVSRFDATGSQLLFSTFVGGTGFDYARTLEIDLDGTFVIGGWTDSADFPVTLGAYDTAINGARDAFITRLAADGSQLVFSSFFGGSEDDAIHSVALDPFGSAFVTGETRSTDLPVTVNAFDADFNGGSTDLFVAKFNVTGNQLSYSSYLGGSSFEEIDVVRLGPDGSPILAGRTWSADFPTTPGAYDTTLNGQADAFVVRFMPDLDQLLYATFIGGSLVEWADDIAISGSGQVTFAGFTESPDFPTTLLAFDRTYGGGGFLGTDGFVARLGSAGNRLVYSTYLGGSGDDFVYSIALDEQQRAIVTGMTRSVDFPTTSGSFAENAPGGNANPNGFVTRLSTDGNRCEYATYLGGQDDDFPLGLHLAADGAVIVGGYTRSADFPVTSGAFSKQHSGSYDVFVSRLRLGPTVEFFGQPLPGHLTRFEIEGAPSALTSHSAQVILSCSGTSGIRLPGGLSLPLTFDACTSLGLRLAPILQATITASGTGLTPPIFFPSSLPSGLTVHFAALFWSPQTALISAVTPPGSLVLP